MIEPFALSHVNLVDIENNRIEPNTAVFCDSNGLIDRIVSGWNGMVPAGYREISLRGKYLMPGLINAHVHLFGSGEPMEGVASPETQKRIVAWASSPEGKAALKQQMKQRLEMLVHSGVTTVRCVGEAFYHDVALREEIKADKWIGPRLLASGYMISITGGHGAPYLARTTDTPQEGIKHVQEMVQHGVDWIKVCVTGGVADSQVIGQAGRLEMTEEEVTAICGEAHRLGLMVAAHVESTEGVRVALRGGVDTIEHGSDLDEEIIDLFLHNPRTKRGYSALTSTLHACVPTICMGLEASHLGEIHFVNNHIVGGRMIRSVKQALDAGILVGMGTDAAMSYVPHNSTWRELLYLNHCVGVEPWQALSIATRGSAELLGIDDRTGTLTEGKDADLLVLDENPLENLCTLEKPVLVAARGRLIEHPETHPDEKIEAALRAAGFGSPELGAAEEMTGAE